MARSLSFHLEASDVLFSILRLHACDEAQRWPRDVSAVFRKEIQQEFVRLEPCVRTLGVCYAELEKQHVAELSRRSNSRFTDIDSALHLAGCSIEVAANLEAIRVGLQRADVASAEGMAGLASALRTVLWYAVHTDLLVCPRARIDDGELSPERMLSYVDAYLAEAWGRRAPATPPMPKRTSSQHRAVSVLQPAIDGQQQSVFPLIQDAPTETDPTPGDGVREFLLSLPDESTAPGFSSQDARAYAQALTRDVTIPSQAPTLFSEQTPHAIHVLSDDAMFFLEASGASWPCTEAALRSAHDALVRRLPVSQDEFKSHATIRHWLDRVERGFNDLLSYLVGSSRLR
jgi:hypothetical protein